jgi:hypothetical protein
LKRYDAEQGYPFYIQNGGRVGRMNGLESKVQKIGSGKNEKSPEDVVD